MWLTHGYNSCGDLGIRVTSEEIAKSLVADELREA
jgi:hypothetical protein